MYSIVKCFGNNWDGALYKPNDKKDKVMIVMSGSEGGLEHAGKMAKFLYDNGISALAFGYFKTKHTQKELDKIPVESVGNAINWLKGQGYKSIGIEAASKGAELALAAAIEYSDISCVIIKTPSWYYSEGLKKQQPSETCCWSIQGQELPFTPYKIRRFNMLKMMWQAKEYNILPINTGKCINEKSVIPVEKIKAPILMFSTKADTIWPSEESCKNICNRLEQCGFTYPYKHVGFSFMSHMMLEYCGKEIKYFIKSEKANPGACSEERKIMGRECLEWIETVWKQNIKH